MKKLALLVGLVFCVGVSAPTPEDELASLVGQHWSKSVQLADFCSAVNDASDMTDAQKTFGWQLILDKSALQFKINYFLSEHPELQAPALD